MKVYSRGFSSMTLLLGIALTSFLTWAAIFEIDQTVRAQGQVIANSRTQIIQVVDGGVLQELFVQEGDTVNEGELLAVLDPERAKVAHFEVRARVAALEASLVRLHAEIQDRDPVFGKEFDAYPAFVQAQLGLYHQRRQSLNEQLALLRDTQGMFEDELRGKQRLFKTGDISRLEVLRSQQQILEVSGKIADLRNRYLQEAHQEISKVEGELASQREQLNERRSVLEKMEVRAAISGQVKYLRVTTIGGVLKGGEELMQIAPSIGGVVIEVKVVPSEIGQLRLGLPVSIKLDAYDFSTFGALSGELIYISPDTLVEQNSEGGVFSYYRAHVRIHDEQNNPRSKEIAIMLGMSCIVDIQAGKRTVLNYLAKPLVQTLSSAFNEK